MPRRKQEAPKRAAAYSPEELTEHTVEAEDAEAEDGAPAPQDDLHVNDEVAEKSTAPVKEQACDQESAGAAELSGQEVDSESHVSETSDRLSDFESTGRKTEGGMAVCSQNGDAKTPPLGIDTLEQMKAIYSSFLTSPLWSPLNFSTPPQVQSSASTEKPTRSNSTSSSSSCSSGSYDWHQSAVAKTLQQQPPQSRHPVQTEHSLFSTVQLHRQNPKLFGSIFSGASKFRCKGCSAAYDTLVELTVHMNDTGHYRDDNQERAGSGGKRWSKPRKRSLLEMEGKEDAQKVLKCMYCGHSFESLQDLSVHMIKTKHYQKVPLKEPMAPVAAKIMSSKKRGLVGLDLTASPRSREGTPKNKPQADLSEVSPKTSSSPYTISNNRYGHQNGTSYAWQFESNKLQILKCMECGSSYNTLQELRTHMMVTGHFLRVTSSVGKKTQTLSEATSLNPARVTTPTEPRVQSVPLAPSTFSPPSLQTTPTSPATTPPLKEIKKEEIEEECTLPESVGTEKQVAVSVGKEEEEDTEKEEKCDISKYNYLTEEDLKESPKGGFDILKSLENTVTAAINKAQSGNPSWGGYPSIHAAYQFPGAIKLQQGNVEKTSPLKLLFNGGEGNFSSLAKNQPLISPPLSQSSPFPCNNFQAMEDLVKKVTEKVAKVEQRVKQLSPKMENRLSSCSSEAGESPKGREADSPLEWRASTPASSDRGSHRDRASPDTESKRETAVSSPLSSTLKCSTAIITGHTPPEQPFVNPLSALQSVMNIHLGKAAKPALPNQDPLSLLSRLNQSMAERAAVAGPPLQTKKSESVADNSVCQPSDDQPIDLTKGKTKRGGSNGSAPLTPSSTASSISPTSLITPTKLTVVSPYTSSSPLHENALSDISDMLRNLTQSHHVPKPPSRSRDKDEIVGSTQDEEETSLNGHKRKGRHSNWNPQHLLLLQAQFASSLRQTSDGKYIINDLSPQERMHVSRFTGLSMTTISHWLANVKYQLRRTGRTKFLKNLDSGQPMFFCSDCASQVRTPATYVCHLEAHLGFRIKDLAKLSPKQTIRDSHTLSEKLVPLESFISPQSPDDCSSNGAVYRCQLCVRKFATKHAIKLHLSKSHGKSPEDHLLYVCEVAKH